MTRSRLFGFLGFFFVLAVQPVVAADRMTIDESRIRIEIADTATLKLPVASSINQPISTSLELQFLGPNDAVLHDLTVPVVVETGSTVVQIPLPGFLELADSGRANYGWMRLKYALPGDSEGIVSVSSIAREPFVMRVLMPPDAIPSRRYRVQVLAQDPSSGKPAPSLEVTGRLLRNGSPRSVSKGRTDSSGYAELNFDLSRDLPDSDLELEVTGKIGGFVRRVSDSISIEDKLQVVTSTDKPVYQPGQKLRVRALVFDRMRNAAKATPLDVSILDAASDKVFQVSLRTSEFGEAHTEWEIPDNARTGNYEIRIEPPNGFPSSESVWVGRYDLPNFSIGVVQDRSYYVPGQSAEVDIRADYLFGKSVPLAHVKVVRELLRRWNYRESKWDIKEGEVIEGSTDRDGRFHTRLGLEKDFENLGDYLDFADLNYSAHVTDPTTNRTEQRRFSVRIALFPIHLYVLEPFQSRGVPLEFYVTASYADGSPAICDIEVLEAQGEGRRRLGTVRTNKYGVAKVTGLRPSEEFGRVDTLAQLELLATDSEGKRGRTTQYARPNRDVLRVYTDKTIYRGSEPIEVRIESSISDGQVLLSASSDDRILYRTTLQLSSGKGGVRIPPSRAFTDRVLVTAYYSGNMNTPLFEGRQVSFPPVGGLEIESSVAQKSYLPGDEVTLNLQVRDGSRSPHEGLLGVSIFDKAVEERARADSEFGGRYSLCSSCVAIFDRDYRLPGFSSADLDHVNRTRSIPPDLELAAEALLANWDRYSNQPQQIRDFKSVGYEFRLTDVSKRFNALKNSPKYPSGFNLPSDEPSLREMVLGVDPDFDSLRDPWGNPYHLVSSLTSDQNRIAVVSSGVDERFGSTDDLNVAFLQWPYFGEYGKALRAAIAQYHERTAGYIRDFQTLKDELRRSGQDFDAWRDPRGNGFSAEFAVNQTRFSVLIKSQGRTIWTEGIDYTAELRPKIDIALNEFLVQRGRIPSDHSELIGTLQLAGVSDNELQDPWGRSYYSVFKTETGYFDSIVVMSVLTDTTRLAPITRTSQVIRLRSAGVDGAEGTSDDFTVAAFLQPVAEQTVEAASPQFVESPLLDPQHGAIYGAVVDSLGSLIPGVSIQIAAPMSQQYELRTGNAGEFVLRNLDPGIYEIRVSLPGFQTKVLTGVIVRVATATRVLARLEVASMASTVEVNAEIISSLPLLSTSVGEAQLKTDPKSPKLLSTPKLREYFPETLLWQPALETGRDGRVQVRFKLADSITTWKATVIASTKDGRIAIAEKEIIAFQPFFVEHDPPKFLTEGDQISLPIVARSYLNRDQSLDLAMSRENWFAPLDSVSRNVEIKAGESLRETFTFKALMPIKDGRQRVTAQGSDASDAVEKTSTVYPLGREMTQVSSGVFRGTSTHNVTFPQGALAGSVRAELKIYPNLMAHIVDAIEAIMRRPYGCAEQAISSAYPGLLYLRYNKQAGRNADATSQKAVRYLQLALQTLRGYQTGNGGFSYWTRGEADTAVTAYTLQFLTQASEFTAIDDEMLSGARKWLLDHQSADGSWENEPQLTSYVTTVLSMPNIAQAEKDPVPLALAYLEKHPGQPYVAASIALTALNRGDKQLADSEVNTLRTVVHRERDSAFWDLQTNTPFYSWGLPGRLESTAIAVKALAASGSDPALVDQGLLFLLRNKDQFGIWYSTQATVRVLEALFLLAGKRDSDTPGSADVVVNGVRVVSIPFGTREQPNNPVTLDLSKFMTTGNNHVEVVERKKSSTATIQLVANHYVPWNASASDLATGPLRFSVRFSKQEAGINEPISVYVEAERVGFRGYGMMLAEIGLPPGAEVDRASLSAAMESSGWSLTRYDVLPDRVIVYLWPRAGGTAFEFQFRPRFGLIAHTPASRLYDYYNPDAHSILPPAQFTVR